MPLRDVLAAALSGPASTVVDGPVRTIVQEVLQDHGFASPAELQAVRDEVRHMHKQVADLAKIAEASVTRADALETRINELTEQLSNAEKAMVEATLEAAEAVKRAEIAEQEAADARAALEEASAGAAEVTPVRLVETPCKVDGCSHYAQQAGFCLDHLEPWKAGRLDGFVGPEGLVDVDGKAYRVDAEYVGQPYEITGKKSRRVKVAGSIVRKTAV